MAFEEMAALFTLGSFLMSVYGFVRLCRALDRSFVWKTLWLIATFAAYCAAGFGLVWWLSSPPAPEGRALAAAVFTLCWIGYGGVWLARLAPRGDGREPGPLHPTKTDLGFAIAALSALAYLLFG